MRIRAALILLVVSAAMASLGGQTFAEPGNPVPAPSDASSEPKTDAVDEAAVAAVRYAELPGFASTTADYNTQTVTLYWKGEPPADVQKFVAASHGEVKVILESSPYSADDFDTAATAILATESEMGSKRTITGVAPQADMTGVKVEMVGDALKALDEGDSVRTLSSIAEMPVTLEPSAPLTQLTRQNDSAPWQGGGAVAFAGGGDYCSTGFAILRNGIGYLLSAHHCYPNGTGTVARDGVGDRIGTVSNLAFDRDSALIDPDATPATVGKVFGGPWNAGTGHARYQFNVVGAAGASNGAAYCTSGAITGEHCGLDVQDVGKHFPCGLNLNGDCIGFEVHAAAGAIAAGVGDSGGPVYGQQSGPNVGARGAISNTSASAVNCNQTTSEPTNCFRWINVSGIVHILNTWGATIETN